VAPTEAHPLEILRQRTSEKWRSYSDDVLPMFVAEMDYPLAPPIKSALHAAIDLGDTGYVDLHEVEATRALAKYATDAWGWSPSPDRMGITTDVSVVIVESLRRLIAPGEPVIITPPIYPPFFDLVSEAGGVVAEVPLLDDGDRFALDLDGIDRAMAAGARGVLLCNPHNPVGLVPSRDSLSALSRIVDRHGGFVVSDEIHAPLTHHGHEFIPYLSVSDQARDHGIGALSASKAFNLAGLKCAFFVAESDRMTALIKSLPEEVTSRAGLFGVIATREGLNNGREWLDATISAVEANVRLLEQELTNKLPTVRLRRPDASYLAWLDFTALEWGDDPATTALEHAKVALSSGPAFGQQGRGHARINIGCHPDTIIAAVDRLAQVAKTPS
jgi:cystathionine beta-lyase